MAMNFNDVLNTNTSDIERPPLMPVGTYEWLIHKVPSMDTIGDGAWDVVDIPLKCIRPMDDVDSDALREFRGDVKGLLQNYRFMFDKNDEHKFKDTLFRLKRFLEETCGVEPGQPLKQALNAAVNKRILAAIVWRQDKNDTELFHANIGRTAPVE